ncbi:MAG TPA: Zn-dependent hydrolase [Candidatus Rokubacteria bacterium]|nr:Zn-dependent hydrolase [Candidatus Rokubacteria bacterium]
MGIAPKATERWFILGTAPPGSQGLYCRFVIAISPARLRARLEALARFGALPGGGVTRPCWSPPHEAARAWLLGELRAASLQAWVDPAGNVFGATGPPGLGADRPVVLTGSHIDTVPEGGILDGALGVLAGLECLEALREAGAAPRLPLAVAAWSDEEGRYGSLFGSRAFTGRLDEERIPDLAAVDGERLVDAMARAGFDARRAPEARAPAGAVAAYVELHIEQGPRLEEAGIPIGVVDSIVGVRRARVVFTGQADHAGTTPMDRRRDGFLAAAEYALRARDLVVRRGGGRSVTNVGVVHVHPGVSNIVPARAELVHEMRSPDADVLAGLAARCESLARRVARRRGVGVEVQPMSATAPAACAPRVMAAIEAACATAGLASTRLHSAAGHDAQNLAAVTDAGMIFIPSRGGRSHRVDEMSDWEAIGRGAGVLLGTLLALAR